MTNLDSILESRDNTLLAKVRIVKAMVFLVVMHGCENWTLIKKAKYQRTDAFELWCSRKLFRVPWPAKRSNQSILKEISPEYSLEGLMLKFWYFSHLMRRADSFEKTLMLGKREGTKRRGWHTTRWSDGTTNSMDMSEQAPGDGEGQGSLVCCSPWGCKQLQTRLSGWTTTIHKSPPFLTW